MLHTASVKPQTKCEIYYVILHVWHIPWSYCAENGRDALYLVLIHAHMLIQQHPQNTIVEAPYHSSCLQQRLRASLHQKFVDIGTTIFQYKIRYGTVSLLKQKIYCEKCIEILITDHEM